MHVWVDADACPGPIREILFRAASRRRIETTFVANRAPRVPSSPFIHVLVVAAGFDVADERIVERLAPGDLVITADVPLAAQVVGGGATALNPRGTLYTEETIDEHLSRRDLMDELRSTGVVTGGPPPLSRPAIQAFADALDRYLTKHAAG